jgi:hypothetical protein
MSDAGEPRAIRFISERVTVTLAREPDLTKKPECPTEFVWRDERFPVLDLLSEWHEYERRGRMAANMRPAHLATARRRGSWGVGRHLFRVRTAGGRVFDLYYDRAPRGPEDRQGSWYLRAELEAADG